MTTPKYFPIKKTKKSKLQKSALYFAAGSVIAAFESVIYLMLKIDTRGLEKTYKRVCWHPQTAM